MLQLTDDNPAKARLRLDRPAGLEEEHWLCATSAQRRQSQTLTEREQRQIFSFLSLPTFYLLLETCGANTFQGFSSLDDFIIPKTNSPSLGRTVLQLLSPCTHCVTWRKTPAPIPSAADQRARLLKNFANQRSVVLKPVLWAFGAQLANQRLN